MNKTILKKYANLIIKSGASLKKGQVLVVSGDIAACALVREVAHTAYKCGAKKVIIKWKDEAILSLDYKYQTKETLGFVPPYEIAERETWADEKYAFVAIVSDDPDLLTGCDADKVATRHRATAAAFKRWRKAELSNEFHWTIAAYPSLPWAKKVFPHLTAAQAVKSLWQCIIKACRLDSDNPVAAWAEHSARLATICEWLSGEDIDSLHYSASNGTRLTIGMPENYVFMGGSELGQDGSPFNANIPSEEVFSAPARDRVDGIVYSSLPLCRNGSIIENFWLRFEKGRVVDFDAQKGKEVLESIIETDEGSHYLGEVALVPYNSPLQNMGVLFYETLYDENASCHLALGGAYGASVRGGEKFTEEEMLGAKLNVSNEHVDFMIGTPDLNIVATRRDGTTFVVISNGEFQR